LQVGTLYAGAGDLFDATVSSTSLALNQPVPASGKVYVRLATNDANIGKNWVYTDYVYLIVPLSPTAKTLPATNVTITSGTMNASVNPHGADTNVVFKWGIYPDLSNTTPAQDIGAGNTPVSVSFNLTGLMTGKSYLYEVSATNSQGTGTDFPYVFLTGATPTVTASPPTNITSSGATFNAMVNPNGAVANVYFGWGTTTSYGNAQFAQTIPAGTTPVTVSLNVTGLNANTTYHYFPYAFGSSYAAGGDVMFKTGPTIAPGLTVLPTNQTVTAGQTATFSVSSNGDPSPTYQWRKGGTNIPGAVSASYTTPATVPADNGSTFDVVVSNVAGTVTSNVVTLTVLKKVRGQITSQ
jgi:hypothetical protein